jgi:hypothetical protein
MRIYEATQVVSEGELRLGVQRRISVVEGAKIVTPWKVLAALRNGGF